MAATAESLEKIHTALRKGRSTAQARQELAAQADLVAQRQGEAEGVIAAFVTSETEALRKSILAECQAFLPEFEPPVLIESVTLTRLMEARAKRDEIEATRAELSADLANLKSRLADVESQINAIHAGGDRSDAALGIVTLLAMDQVDIQALMSAAETQLAALKSPPVADLERAWKDTQVNARFAARAAVMTELERRLLAMADEARSALGATATHLRYRPGAGMRQAVSQSIV